MFDPRGDYPSFETTKHGLFMVKPLTLASSKFMTTYTVDDLAGKRLGKIMAFPGGRHWVLYR